ncbi:LADA_0C01706g1_1 [Lachancea dasiensis]|uniref:LADA_0C01706g1_1 n=1 Tax=Lachancea dasiensis TaxID=1072105 RepID=A0A1G4IXS7_9SACH|nr:LADA_0C01706g1_1 [Lachancea dasiensis]
MGKTHAPEVIRVKRKREEDSVRALVLQEDGSSKRAKFVFKLARTIESGSYAKSQELKTPLLKLSEDGDARHFILEQRKRKREQGDLPTEISEMLDEYLSLKTPAQNGGSAKLKRPSRRKSETPIASEILPSGSYVYDIYYRELAAEDEFVYDPSTVGYIKIIEDHGDMIPEEEEADQAAALSDDEDSNDEAYYRNDYPEDEDDDRPVLFGSDDENGVEVRTDAWSDENSLSDAAEAESIRRDIAALQDSETDALFEKYAQETDILQAAGNNFYDVDDVDIEDSEDSGEDGTASFARHSFFPGDAEDPLALHRDEIFGRLEQMLEKR